MKRLKPSYCALYVIRKILDAEARPGHTNIRECLDEWFSNEARIKFDRMVA